jgi:hypothetical protein
MFTRHTLALLLSIITLSSCDTTVEGTGSLTRSERSLVTFTELEVRGALTVIIEQGPPSFTLETNENLHEHVKADVEDGRLIIHTDKKHLEAEKLEIHVRCETLEELQVKGWCDVRTRMPIKGERFKVELSGGGKADISAEVRTFAIDISGAAEVKLKGAAEEAEIDISGAAEVDGAGFTAQEATVSVSGAGEVSIRAEKELDVRVSGAAKVNYYGNPDVDQKVSGSAQITKVE